MLRPFFPIRDCRRSFILIGIAATTTRTDGRSMKTGLRFLAISILVLANPCFAQKTSEARHMRFGYTILYVSNLASTLTFYEKAFGFEPGISIKGQYAELKTGTTTLAFAQEAFVKTLTDQPFTRASKQAGAVDRTGICDGHHSSRLRQSACGGRDRGQETGSETLGPNRRLRQRSQWIPCGDLHTHQNGFLNVCL